MISNLNIYHVKSDNSVDYDEYNGAVIIAKNRKEAAKLADTLPVQSPYTVKKLGETAQRKPCVVLDSFNAG